MKRYFWAGLFFVTFNAWAFLEDEEARKKLNELQVQLNNINQELSSKISDLDKILKAGSLNEFNQNFQQIFDELSKLSGDIEVLQHNFKNYEERQKVVYQDYESRLNQIEERISKLESQPHAEVKQVAKTESDDQIKSVQSDINRELGLPDNENNPADESNQLQESSEALPEIKEKIPPLVDDAQEKNMFNEADTMMRSTKYKEAFEVFNRFVSAYPKSTKLVQAKKNIAYIQFALKNYKASLSTYEKLITDFPNDPLIPEILYGKANTEIQLTQITNAKKTLKKLIKEYPNAENIEAAKKRLKALESIKL